MADSRFKVEQGLLVAGPNTQFVYPVEVTANLTVGGSMLYVGGNLVITGNIVYSNTQIAGDLSPLNEGSLVGNSTLRFDSYLRNLEVSNTLYPTSNGVPLGSSTKRWNINANTLSVSSTSTFGANVDVTGTTTSTVVRSGNTMFCSNTKQVTNTSANIIDGFPANASYSSKVFINVKPTTGTAIHSIEMTIVHDGTNVLLSRYGEIYNTKLGTFDSNIVGSNVEITFTANTANTYNVKTTRFSVI